VQCEATTSTGKSGFPNRTLDWHYMSYLSAALQLPRRHYTILAIAFDMPCPTTNDLFKETC
ncbi:MAG: hypothetical protein WAN72_01775, partial [Candidatus Acidiferrales bacterium]